MKMLKISKFLSVALATVFAVSFFSMNSFAMSATAQAHVRALTPEEIGVIATVFNAKYYANRYPDVVAVYGTEEASLLNHFVTFGIWEQRQPTAEFNVDAYATRNPDLHYENGDDIVAYYLHYAYYPAERANRVLPTLEDSYYHDTDVYSVYDFVKGQYGPRKGAIPVSTRNYHPDFEIKGEKMYYSTDEYYKNETTFEEKWKMSH